MAKRESFFKGAAILVVTSVFIRLAGMGFRIYFARVAGAEGMGLYQLIFSVYTFMSTFATAGIAAAATRIVAQGASSKLPGAQRTAVQVSAVCAAVLGFFAMVLLYFGAGPTAKYWLQDMRTLMPLKILAFALPAMALTAVYRGYFVAVRRVAVQSFSQVLEQVLRLAVIFAAMAGVEKGDIAGACNVVVVGNLVSEVAACLYIVLRYYTQKPMPQKAKSSGGVQMALKGFLAVMLPVAAGGSVKSLLHTLENTLVPGQIALFLGSSTLALAQFGVLKGMVMPVLMFPAAFLVAVAMLLVPEVTEDLAAGRLLRMQKTVGWALHLTMLSTVILAALFIILAEPICLLLYDNSEAAFYMQILGPILPFIYLEAITEGLLRGLNQQKSSLQYTMIDSVLRIGLIMFLVPQYGMQGFLYIMLASNIFTSGLNLQKLLATSGVRVNWVKWAVLPCAAAFACTVPAGIAMGVLKNCGQGYILQILAGGTTGAVIYVILCFILRCFTKKDIDQLVKILVKKA